MEQRTTKQNKSLHKFFDLLATELNGKGYDMRVVLKPSYRIDWDSKSVKEHLWKELQSAMYNKKSTTELTTSEINKVYEQLMRMLTEKFDQLDFIDFPSEESTPEYYKSYENI